MLRSSAAIAGGLLCIAATSADEPAYVPGEVIVVYKDNTSTENLSDTAIKQKGIRGKILKKTKLARARKNMLHIKLDNSLSVKDALDENWGGHDPDILCVEPNYLLFTQGLPNDPRFSQQWALYNYGQTGGVANCDINMPQAWDITTGSADVIVAVIDTGVDYTHPDLVSQMWTNPGEVANNGIDDDNNGYIDDIYGFNFAQNTNNPFDENGHGTHCAGIIAAKGNNAVGTAGISWGAKIMACRFLGATGSGTVADAVEAINYAVANGARILNNSWGGTGYSAALEAAIQNAKNHEVLFVAAAGNSAKNNDVTPHYPSSYPISNIIAVAATSHTDTLASFSCYGKQSVHIGAPGVSILSTVPNGYASYSGTSMAAPQVSGAAALLISMNPSMSLLELKDRLLWTGDAAASLDQKTATGRRLNTYNALAVPNRLQIISPSGQPQWSNGFSYTIQWISIGAGPSVNLYLLKNGQVAETLAENLPNQRNYSWTVPADIESGSDYSILISDGTLSGQSETFTLSSDHVDYYTESFVENINPFDLCHKSVLFVPVEEGCGYQAIAQDIDALPVAAGLGIRLRLGDDDSKAVSLLTDSIVYFGQSYSSVYVGSNGYITFDQPDYEYRTGVNTHFSKKRLSVFFQDLNPAADGAIYWKEMSDRAVVTWLNVPIFAQTTPNTFQAELFFDGKIRLSWLDTVRKNCLTGLSCGGGKPLDYMDSDISVYSSYSPVLELIAIEGPLTFNEDENIQLRCIGYFEQNIVRDLTDDGTINWDSNAAFSAADINNEPLAEAVGIFRHIDVSAQVEEKTDNIGLLIKGQNTQDILIEKGVIKAGTVIGNDALSLTGQLTLSLETLRQADAVTVKLWSNSNECLRQAVYPVIEQSFRNSLFVSTQKQIGSPEGVVRQLRIDTLRGLFRYTLKAADLRAMGCPAYLTIECGDYAGVGQMNQVNINKGQSIPAILMNGISDTICFGRTKLLDSAVRSRDSVYAAGCFSLQYAAESAEDVMLLLNDQQYLFPSVNSSVRRGIQTFHYVTPDGQILRSQLNFRRGTFTMTVKRTNLLCNTQVIDWGLTFDDFNESQKKAR